MVPRRLERGDREGTLMGFEARRDGDIITVSGELDLATAPKLRALLDAIQGAGTVTVDLDATTFVDSQGLATLTAAKQRLNSGLRIVNPRDNVRRVLEITNLDSILLDD
jgi:anti-sigma B factor antagonist